MIGTGRALRIGEDPNTDPELCPLATSKIPAALSNLMYPRAADPDGSVG
jgi:hypothetical protein